MTSKAFVRLERSVEREYRAKGRSLADARRIGRAVAGKVAREKRARRNPSGIQIGKTFVWTSPGGDKTDYKIERTKVGFDEGHVLARRTDTGEAYRVAKTADGKRLSGAPKKIGGARKGPRR